MVEHQEAVRRVTEDETLCAATMSLARNARRNGVGVHGTDHIDDLDDLVTRCETPGAPILGTSISPTLQITVLHKPWSLNTFHGMPSSCIKLICGRRGVSHKTSHHDSP